MNRRNYNFISQINIHNLPLFSTFIFSWYEKKMYAQWNYPINFSDNNRAEIVIRDCNIIVYKESLTDNYDPSDLVQSFIIQSHTNKPQLRVKYIHHAQ